MNTPRGAPRRDATPVIRALWVLVALGIVYGSLYPFDFGKPLPRDGISAWLFDSLRHRPSRGDLIANLVLYLPFGLLGALALRGGVNRARTLGAVIGAGTALSVAIESAQFFAVGRSTSLIDVFLNVLSTAVGAGAGMALRTDRPLLPGGLRVRDPFALMLAASWLAYRLAPFVPTLDLQHIRDAMKHLLTANDFDVGRCARYTVAWLVVGICLRTGLATRVSIKVLPAIGLLVAIAPLGITGRELMPEEFVAVALASLAPLVIDPDRRTTLAIFVLHCAVVLAVQLAPFTFGPVAHDFSFIPFSGILTGSREVGVFAIFEKFFLYGVAVWLPVRLGWRIGPVTTAVALALLLTEVLQVWLPGRGAEITDPLLAILAACILDALRSGSQSRA